MKTIKNMRELRLVRQKLEFQEQLYEKELAESTADIIDNLTDKLRDTAFDVGSRLLLRLIHSRRKHHTPEE
ncbi:hypothetical protein D1164_19905 [Mariniphaga sediminis]|jgi:hypothetical protein|uniref:Uncharacterized protein n=1 Tax=Mariniphaga sediminis TaxID=1628158 RepID=A0A399CVE1_9BACT|nr:hypothetical protein [Mariniphaga sediminis]RIH63397.1 hypothetical protein D1164_19905 [Mariniphaga sediminis]